MPLLVFDLIRSCKPPLYKRADQHITPNLDVNKSLLLTFIFVMFLVWHNVETLNI